MQQSHQAPYLVSGPGARGPVFPSTIECSFRVAVYYSAAHHANNLLCGMASQALWRPDPKRGRGLDGTVAYDWSPAAINVNNKVLTAGLRFNEPLPLPIHNTMSLGFVQNGLSPQFLPPTSPRWHAERGLEFNTLLDPLPMLLVQPVIQYYTNVGG